jgi:hypothetical protein
VLWADSARLRLQRPSSRATEGIINLPLSGPGGLAKPVQPSKQKGKYTVFLFTIIAQVIQNRKGNEKKIWILDQSCLVNLFVVLGGNTNESRIMIDSSLRRLGISFAEKKHKGPPVVLITIDLWR